MLEPLVADHSELEGALRYRQIEYYRMPLMAYLAVDDPRALTRNDFIRLGLVTGSRGRQRAAVSREQHLADFEQRHCYDRFWSDAGSAPRTRYLCSGHALVVVGDARAEFYRCRDRGVLAQFRHQHFLLFMIAHFQKAALLMFSDRLVEALKRLDIADADERASASSARSAAASRASCASRTATGSTRSRSRRRRVRCSSCAPRHLGLDPLYAEVKERIARHEHLPRRRQPAPPGQHGGAA